MAEAPNPSPGSYSTKAPKSKRCDYCQQAFTASSLGRHLDQFIKAKNPKAPDGVHDVEQIRRLRERITRRHPKGTFTRRATSASGDTPAARSKKGSVSADPESPSSVFTSPVSAKGIGTGSTIGRTFPFDTPWTATGVKTDIPNILEHGPQEEPIRRPTRSQYDDKKDEKDLKDKARAAELALLELIGSLRAARQHIDIKSIPFDVNPLSLDFPASVLRFLDAPPTLFASIPTPTSTSWSIEPPWEDQLISLKSHFTETIRKRKATLAVALKAVSQELISPPPDGAIPRDAEEELLQAERALDSLEGEIFSHLDNTFKIWRELRLEDRERYWKLELARSVSRNQAQADELKKNEHSLRQEISKLRSQIEQLEHLQQPREFKIMHPTTVQFSSDFVHFLAEDSAAHPRHGASLLLADHSLDLDTVVSKYIARWKEPVRASRSPEAGSSSQQLAGRVNSTVSEKGAPQGSANVAISGPGEWNPQATATTTQEQRQPPTGLQPEAQRKESQFGNINSTQPLSNNGSADTDMNQNADEVVSGDDGDGDGEADIDADGDEDEDADINVDIDTDGDVAMDRARAYNGFTASSEGLSHQQEHVITPQHQQPDPPPHQNQHHPQGPAEIPSHTQQHILSPQQHHGQAVQTGAVRTRPTGTLARFNPHPSNNNHPASRNMTGGVSRRNSASVVQGVPHGNNAIRIMNRSASANIMAAFHGPGDGGGTGGLVHHPQYMTGHGNTSHHFTSSGVGHGQGQHMGRVPETIGAGQPIGQVISQRTTDPMYTIPNSDALDTPDYQGD